MKFTGAQVDKFVFGLVVLDLMFFPYVRALSASLSMIVLPWWFIFRCKTLVNDAELKFGVIAIFLLVVSFLCALVVYSGRIVLRNGGVGSVFAMLPNAVVVFYMIIY